MTAAIVNLAVDCGSTFRKTLIWKTGTPATPVNLTGYTARMQVRATAGSTTVLISLTSASGITLGGVLGTIALTISDTVTSGFDWEFAVYDLELIAPSGDVTRLVQGDITTSREVTR